MSTITLTFGDQAENHVGMQKIGTPSEKGYSLNDLILVKNRFDSQFNISSYILDLHEALPKDLYKEEYNAYILIVKNAVNAICEHELAHTDNSSPADMLLAEQNGLEKDKKALMYGKVVNKHARHNLCFDDNAQEPDYSNGKGTIIAFNSVPILDKFRQVLDLYIDSANTLAIEGNYYYDITKCGIGYHGDSERKKVIGVRLGDTLPLYYQWYHKGKPVGDQIKILLNHGDLYVMSQKATGNDWKLSKILTLRHAAGCSKFTTVK